MDEIVNTSNASLMANETLKQHKQSNNEYLPGCAKLTTVWRQHELFVNNRAAKVVCECLKTRNMCKLPSLSTEQQILKSRRKKRKENNTTKTTAYQETIPRRYTMNTRNSKYANVNKQLKVNAPSDLQSLMVMANRSRTTTRPSMNVYNNLLQNLVGSVLWHVTASTVISILATLYFIANTQGASAISVVTSMPTSLSSSLTNSFVMYSSIASIAAAMSMPIHTPPSVLPTLLPLITTNLSFMPTTTTSYSITNSSTSSDGSSSYGSSLPATMFVDFNNNYRINSTEITYLNGVSSLASNKISAFSNDNNNNNNNNINNVITVSYNNVISVNDTFDDMSAEDSSEYIFDRTDVRIIFITLYTIVFCCCFFGK